LYVTPAQNGILILMISDEIRSRIATADVVRAIDESSGLSALFHGRVLREGIADSGITRHANVVGLSLDFGSESIEELDAFVREVKGDSCFQPAELFPEIDIDTESFVSNDVRRR